ncbi:hypothetical protein NSA53_01735 [Cellulosimicrobium cellulans]|uniref:hypothetical protein n=1 Tax=Cellulosimicrobium TaxID=157920 RepID=UPI000887A725|nr:hypothetical protein [Cellulosimicrobium cellulans]SDF67397.1 hypothetical protein SAMN04487781_2165 [Cellulosimicrobium cellulans]
MRGAASRTLSAALALVLAAVLSVVPVTAPEPASAAGRETWDPGFIISDSVFYDSGAMSVAQIDAFLRSKGAGCVAGERPCLKDYTENTRAWPAEPGICSGYTARNGETAAQILQRVGASCGINPRVLLVMLQKENSLVDRTRPTARSYDAAMGFGCPDTAPCNTEYYGFFNQVYRAARQYKVYAANPTRYNYQAGRSNYIAYNPKASCGGSQVYIRNQATASLYIYTPYQPNAAALANVYGSGDSCSAYGNRNFWRLFTDWFGNPQLGGYLVKSDASVTVYLVVGSRKFAIPDWPTYLAYEPLGPIATVGAETLDRYASAGELGRLVRKPGTGEIFFVDAGRRYHVGTCQLVADFGSSCPAVPELGADQIALLGAGSSLSATVSLPSGRKFAMVAGTRREVFDDASLSAAGLPTSAVRLSEQALDRFPLGTPVVRDRVLVGTRGSSALALWAGGRLAPLPSAATRYPGVAQLARGTLDAASVARMARSNGAPGLVSRDGAGVYALGEGGLALLRPAALGARPPAASSLPAATFDALPVGAATGSAAALKRADSPTVWVLADGVLRPANTWDDLVSRFGGIAPPVHTVAPETLAVFPTGPPILTQGRLVKTSDSPEVYLVNSGGRVVYVDWFGTLQALGHTRIETRPAGALRGYAIDPLPLQPLLRCADGDRVGIAGSVRRIDRKEAGPTPATSLGPVACRTLAPTGSTVTGPLFVKAPGDSVVYRVVAGTKRPVRSWTALVAMAGTGSPRIVEVSPRVLSTVPTGAMMG